MDKVKEFLEQHVQWLAVGFGGLVLLWSMWTYVLSGSAVGVQYGDKFAGPGEIDKEVLRKEAEAGRALLSSRGPNVPKKPDLQSDFRIAVAGPSEVPTFAGLNAFGTRAYVLDDSIELLDIEIAGLPSVPPVILDNVGSLRAYVEVPDDPMRPDGSVTEEDVIAAKIRYIIDGAALADAFAEQALPPAGARTHIMQVRAVRERKLGDGSWGERTEVAPLRNIVYPEMPADDADIEAKRDYVFDTQEMIYDIVRPPFYFVLEGEDPAGVALDDADDGEDGNDDRPDVAFDPNDPDTWPPTKDLTPEQRRAIRDARRNKNQNPGGFPPGEFGPGGYGGPPPGYGPGGGYGGGGGMQGGDRGGDDDNGRRERETRPGAAGNGGNTPMRQDRDGRGQQGAPQGPPSFPYGQPGGFPYGAGSEFGGGYGGGEFGPGAPFGQPGENARPVEDLGEVPSDFTPSDYRAGIEGFIYDETVQQGETYRYNILYTIRNPLFDTENVVPADRQELTQILPLQVDPSQAEWESGWSEPVVVESMTYWSMINKLPDNSVTFKVFRWQNGQWQAEDFKVEPGDAIGGEVDGVDYSTGRVLVDVREDNATSDTYALVVDNQGRFKRHTDDDRDDEKFQELEEAVSRVATAD